jgi:RNA polymerase sigma-70 factor (ECF subfamily)
MNPGLFKGRYPEVSSSPQELTELTALSLSEQHLPLVFAYVARRVCPTQEAEDVTAEVFAAAFQSLSAFRVGHSPQAWLLGIARRKVADHLRRRSRRREMLISQMMDTDAEKNWLNQLPADMREDPEAALQRDEAARILRELLTELTEEQQEAVRLQYQEELSVAEIAVVMRRSLAAVTGLLQRARATLFRKGRGYFLNEETETR